jgi:hypothetical protein
MCRSNASDVMEKLGVRPRNRSFSESSDSSEDSEESEDSEDSEDSEESEDTEQLVPFDRTTILRRVQAYLKSQRQSSESNAVTQMKKAMALIRALNGSDQSQSVSESVEKLPCSHSFHIECLKEWLRCVSINNYFSFSFTYETRSRRTGVDFIEES